MNIIPITINGNTAITPENSSAGKIGEHNYTKLTFIFDNEWSELDKFLIIKTPKGKIIGPIDILADEFLIDGTLLDQAGTMTITVFGIFGDGKAINTGTDIKLSVEYAPRKSGAVPASTYIEYLTQIKQTLIQGQVIVTNAQAALLDLETGMQTLENNLTTLNNELLNLESIKENTIFAGQYANSEGEKIAPALANFSQQYDLLNQEVTENSQILDNKLNEININWASKQNVLGYTPENVINKGVPNGYASLDSGGKIPLSSLPSTLLKYQSTWNAASNLPVLTTPDLTKIGCVYTISSPGTRFGITWKLGDWLIYNNSGIPEKSDNSDDVTSVNGKTGIINLNTSDIASSANARYVTDADLVKLNKLSGANSGDQDLTGLVPYINAIKDVNLGTHYLYAANLPYGNSVYGGTTVTDLNTIVRSGFYSALGSASNVPDINYSWLITHVNSNSGVENATQKAVAINNTIISYQRVKKNSIWNSWVQDGSGSGPTSNVNFDILDGNTLTVTNKNGDTLGTILYNDALESSLQNKFTTLAETQGVRDMINGMIGGVNSKLDGQYNALSDNLDEVRGSLTNIGQKNPTFANIFVNPTFSTESFGNIPSAPSFDYWDKNNYENDINVKDNIKYNNNNSVEVFSSTSGLTGIKSYFNQMIPSYGYSYAVTFHAMSSNIDLFYGKSGCCYIKRVAADGQEIATEQQLFTLSANDTWEEKGFGFSCNPGEFIYIGFGLEENGIIYYSMPIITGAMAPGLYAGNDSTVFLYKDTNDKIKLKDKNGGYLDSITLDSARIETPQIDDTLFIWGEF